MVVMSSDYIYSKKTEPPYRQGSSETERRQQPKVVPRTRIELANPGGMSDLESDASTNFAIGAQLLACKFNRRDCGIDQDFS